MVLQQRSENYDGFRTAGIRLTKEILPEIRGHRTKTLGDTLMPTHQFDKAHAVMLTEEGIIPHGVGVDLLRGLRAMEAEGVAEARFRAEGGMHSGEQYLIRRLGENIGGWIHVGRSSGDLGAVGRRLALRAKIVDLLAGINELRASIDVTARLHFDTIMPGYTHGQNGQPTTYAHWLAMWSMVFSRDFDRLKRLYEQINKSPAGAATHTGTDFPLNRDRVSCLLGFDAVIPHAMDAIHSHDVDTMEAAAAIAIHTANMTRLAEDIELWFSSEFNFIDIPDEYCGTSSIMMQKKNPYFCEEVKAVGSSASGAFTTAVLVEKGPTGLAIVEHKAPDNAIRKIFDDAIARSHEAADFISQIKVNKDRMETNAGEYWAQATDIAGMLVRKTDIPWRSAHQIVGILVRLSYERDIRPKDTTVAMLDEASELYWGKPTDLSDEDYAASLDPRSFVARRTISGGPAPTAVKETLDGTVAQLEADSAWLKETNARLGTANGLLESAIDALVND